MATWDLETYGAGMAIIPRPGRDPIAALADQLRSEAARAVVEAEARGDIAPDTGAVYRLVQRLDVRLARANPPVLLARGR